MSSKLLVFGLDGTDWNVLDPLIDAGLLPTFKSLKARSCWGPLRSTVPQITPVAWTSSFTGVNPGRHGIFDFFKRFKGGYGLRLVSSKDNMHPTMFRTLSDAGKRVCALNIPFAYPPEPVNGILVSGLGSSSAGASFIYPPSERASLNDLFQGLAAYSLMLRYGKRKQMRKGVMISTEALRRGSTSLLSEREWDLFLVVFDGTDRLQHRFWRFFDRQHPFYPGPHHPEASVIPDYYVLLDGILKDLLERAGTDAAVMMYSDHGFGSTRRVFHLNRALEQAGFLRFRPGQKGLLHRVATRLRKGAAGMIANLGFGNLLWRIWNRANQKEWKSVVVDALDWEHTRAFASSSFHAGVRLNMCGRESQGCVNPADAPRLLSEIRKAMMECRDPVTGELPFREAVPREEIYSGAHVEEAPDLVLVEADGFVVRHGWHPEPFRGLTHQDVENEAEHRPYGIFSVADPRAVMGRCSRPLRIEDVTPTDFDILGVPIPLGLDGQSVLGGKASVPGIGPRAPSDGSSVYTPEEEESIKRRLADLGYL